MEITEHQLSPDLSVFEQPMGDQNTNNPKWRNVTPYPISSETAFPLGEVTGILFSLTETNKHTKTGFFSATTPVNGIQGHFVLLVCFVFLPAKEQKDTFL